MRSMKFMGIYTLIIVLLTCLLSMSGIFVINRAFFSNKTDKVTTDIVIDRVTEQSFLVTRTLYTDQTTEIKIDQGSKWSNFFWGKNIKAEGRVRTDMGVNLADIDKDNIKIDKGKKEIQLKNIQVGILDSSVTGTLEVEMGGSIPRRLLTNKNDEDYAQASRELELAANRIALEDEELKQETKDSAGTILTALFKSSGYKVVLK